MAWGIVCGIAMLMAACDAKVEVDIQLDSGDDSNSQLEVSPKVKLSLIHISEPTRPY